jgi:hypothetical protein
MWEKIVSYLLSDALKFTWEGSIDVALRALPLHAELVVRPAFPDAARCPGHVRWWHGLGGAGREPELVLHQRPDISAGGCASPAAELAALAARLPPA